MNFNTSGIYKITDLNSGRLYIGSAKNFRKRKNFHFWLLRKDKHPNKYLQNIYNKYGESNLEFHPIVITDVENLILFEQMCIDAINPELNLCRTAGNVLGRKHSLETIEKIRKSNIGIKKPGSGFHGNKTAEMKARISATLKAKGIKPPEWARKLPRKPMSNETKEKLSIAHTGTIFSMEHRNKLSLAGLGKKISDETKRNMSKGQKLRREREYAISQQG